MSKNPPQHLSAETKRWWREIVGEYELESHHLKLLLCAAEAWDRMVQAREALALEGLTYSDRFGAPRKRPEVSIEEAARTAFTRAIRELNLDSTPAPDAPRPPRR